MGARVLGARGAGFGVVAGRAKTQAPHPSQSAHCVYSYIIHVQFRLFCLLKNLSNTSIYHALLLADETNRKKRKKRVPPCRLWDGTRGLEDAVQTNQLESMNAPRAHRVLAGGRRRGAEVSPSSSLPSSGPQRKRPSFSAPVTRGKGAGQVGSSDTPVQEGWAGVRSAGASSLLPAAGARAS